MNVFRTNGFQRSLPFVMVAVACVCGYRIVNPSLATEASSISNPAAGFSEEIANSGLHIEATTIDFGRVFEGSKVTCPLKLTNTSGRAVKVVDVSTSCGCTTIESETEFTLQPGEEKSITIQLSTSGNTGPMEKRVTVFTNEAASRFKFPITLRAVSMPLLEISHRELDFEMIRRDETCHREIFVSVLHEHENNASGAAVYVASAPEGVQTELHETQAPDGVARRWTLSVSICGSSIPEEPIDGDLVLVTPSTVEPVIRIPVKARQHSFVSCEPASVNFGVIRGDIETAVAVNCPGDHSFDVEEVIFEGSDAVTSVYDSDAQQVRLIVARSAAEPGFFKGAARIHYRCDGGQRQSLTIPVSGYKLALVE